MKVLFLILAVLCGSWSAAIGAEKQAGASAALLETVEAPWAANCGADGEALLRAVEDRDDDKVIALLDQGCDINMQNQYGLTALHRAVSEVEVRKNENGRPSDQFNAPSLSIATLLIDRGANIHLSDRFHDTALHKATEMMFFFYGAVDSSNRSNEHQVAAAIIDLLSRFGADLNAQNDLGNTPLINSVWHVGDKNAFRVKKLLDLGAITP